MLHRLAQSQKSGAASTVFFYFVQMCLLLIGPGNEWMDWMSFLDM
jgi:hypothetical protein